MSATALWSRWGTYFPISQNKMETFQEESPYGQVYTADNWRDQGFWWVSCNPFYEMLF